MEEELISVVIPVYKVEAYIKRCVECLQKQTYTNIEIILVDDGSPDNCGQICDEYANEDDRIKVIHKENGGISDARNAGIAMAKGKYITFIDSDDYVDEDYIEFLYMLIKENNAQMAICSHRVIYEATKKIIEKETGEFGILDAKTTLERILYDEQIDLSAWAKLYDISLFEKVQFPKGRLFEDAATTYLLVDQCEKIAIGLKGKYNYMIRGDSTTTTKFTTKKMDLITSTKEMTDYVKQKYPDLEKAADRRLMYAYLSTISQLANSKVEYPKEKQQMISYIKEHGNEILKDKRAKKRDKFAIISLKFGFPFYRIAWKFYLKVTNRD